MNSCVSINSSRSRPPPAVPARDDCAGDALGVLLRATGVFLRPAARLRDPPREVFRAPRTALVFLDRALFRAAAVFRALFRARVFRAPLIFRAGLLLFLTLRRAIRLLRERSRAAVPGIANSLPGTPAEYWTPGPALIDDARTDESEARANACGHGALPAAAGEGAARAAHGGAAASEPSTAGIAHVASPGGAARGEAPKPEKAGARPGRPRERTQGPVCDLPRAAAARPAGPQGSDPCARAAPPALNCPERNLLRGRCLAPCWRLSTRRPHLSCRHSCSLERSLRRFCLMWVPGR